MVLLEIHFALAVDLVIEGVLIDGVIAVGLGQHEVRGVIKELLVGEGVGSDFLQPLPLVLVERFEVFEEDVDALGLAVGDFLLADGGG